MIPGYHVVWLGTKGAIYENEDECDAILKRYPNVKYQKCYDLKDAKRTFKKATGYYYNRDNANKGVTDGNVALNNVIKSIVQECKPREPCPSRTAMCVHVSLDDPCIGAFTYYYNWYLLPKDSKTLYPFKKVSPLRLGMPCPASGAIKNLVEFDALIKGLIMLNQHNSPYSIYTESDMALCYLEERGLDDMGLACLKMYPDFGKIIGGKLGWLINANRVNGAGKWNACDWGPNPAIPN